MSPNVIADSRNAASSTEHVSIGGQRLRVAIVHDWLNVLGGAERVLEQILALFPGADIFTLTDTLPATERGFLGKSHVQVSMIGKTPWLRHQHKLALPLMPAAIEAFDLSGYDLVLSSSFAVAKGVITRPDALHVCYCHSPMRYIWDLEHTYRRDAGLDRGIRSVLASFLFNHLRMWDVASASRPQVLMANSNFTASRIARYWGRDAQLLPPPVDLSRFSLQTAKGRDYLTVSRLVPYKRHDLMVQAFADLPERRLLIIGDGPQRAALEKIATHNVVFLGALPDREVAEHMRTARAFLFAAHEDFGIVPVEAQACGTPVIAYGVGGVRDTVRSWPAAQPTGLFFDQQTSESLREAVVRFETIEHAFDPQVLRDNAERFSNEHFRARLGGIIEQALAQRATPDTLQMPADRWVSPAIAPTSKPPAMRTSVTKPYGGGEIYSDIEIAGAM